MPQRAYADSKGYKFHIGSYMIPHPEKAYKGGEDSLSARSNFMAVCDGVGGWANRGIDTGRYSKQLMRFMVEEYAKDPDDLPREILARADQRTTTLGSSTAVIAILDHNTGELRTTNLGDSGYMILRPNSDEKSLTKLH